MSTTTPGVTGTPGTSISNSSAASGTDPMLSKDAFLKLMMVQLQHQDPLSPSDPSQYLGQLAQMTTLEQETNIASATAQSAAAQSTSSAVSLIGHTVDWNNAKGASGTGVVQSVQISGSGPTLTVSGITGVLPTDVTQVS